MNAFMGQHHVICRINVDRSQVCTTEVQHQLFQTGLCGIGGEGGGVFLSFHNPVDSA